MVGRRETSTLLLHCGAHQPTDKQQNKRTASVSGRTLQRLTAHAANTAVGCDVRCAALSRCTLRSYACGRGCARLAAARCASADERTKVKRGGQRPTSRLAPLCLPHCDCSPISSQLSSATAHSDPIIVPAIRTHQRTTRCTCPGVAGRHEHPLSSRATFRLSETVRETRRRNKWLADCEETDQRKVRAREQTLQRHPRTAAPSPSPPLAARIHRARVSSDPHLCAAGLADHLSSSLATSPL